MKSLRFYIPPAWKGFPFWAEPPRIVHYRESPPPPPGVYGWDHDWVSAQERCPPAGDVCLWKVSISTGSILPFSWIYYPLLICKLLLPFLRLMWVWGCSLLLRLTQLAWQALKRGRRWVSRCLQHVQFPLFPFLFLCLPSRLPLPEWTIWE